MTAVIVEDRRSPRTYRHVARAATAAENKESKRKRQRSLHTSRRGLRTTTMTRDGGCGFADDVGSPSGGAPLVRT